MTFFVFHTIVKCSSLWRTKNAGKENVMCKMMQLVFGKHAGKPWVPAVAGGTGTVVCWMVLMGIRCLLF
ncbi:MAG: hypothetical protein A2233_04180 [Candidatus Kerfeldbacteria bacterium RIFOXYA2_FULL_38_24]|uniref:Uncharacterized protein n=1 Tax=Candidatus Kerfeldbacteria bacterium RIFOXYB2_FULL_38_14 TaxID=1798547 RepID=A0A1G2BCG6_9BACT|nr:MAG: hypothetical protein A2233_04180 [Candidatus Kerfeldbacteria bacterium RIFOXYA2_FULL_38_24]OGY86918.1 MAG: hypothetical protein A2319_00030 [Candidatus Kerfeldbacteria bacterium RIFOXYB2_FULL_38_14]